MYVCTCMQKLSLLSTYVEVTNSKLYRTIIIYTIVPTPSVAVNIMNNQTVGRSLILECDLTIVKGITSRVDIVWSSNGVELNTIRGVNVTLVRDNSVSFTDTYTISQLSTTDENKEYQCEVSIDAQSPVTATGRVILNVTGKHRLLLLDK